MKTNRQIVFENSKCVRYAILGGPFGGWRVYEIRVADNGNEFYGAFLAEFSTKKQAKAYKEKMNKEVKQ